MLPRSLQETIKALLTPAVALSLWLVMTPAWAGSMLLLGAGGSGASGGAFTGPLDVVSTNIKAAYCVGACSAAKRGTKFATICTTISTVDTCIDMNSDATTGAPILSTIGGLTCNNSTVICNWKTWTDQSGNSCDATQAGVPTRPLVTVSVSGLTSIPAITFDGATGGMKLVTCSTTAAQPFFISGVGIRTSGTNFASLLGEEGSAPGLLYSNTANNMTVFGTSTPTFTVSDAVWHAVGALFNNTSSQGYTDGTGSGVINAGPSGVSAATLDVGFFSSVPCACNIVEVLLYAADVSSSASALSTNQHIRYGF